MALYQGKKVTLNKIMKSERPAKKSKVYVKKPNGKVTVVHFGDPNMTIKKKIYPLEESLLERDIIVIIQAHVGKRDIGLVKLGNIWQPKFQNQLKYN